MKSQTKIAIIGGGASGLMCAILCAKANIKVDLFEQNNKCGKKILVSGNGKCNISNANISYKNYHSHNKDFVKYALKSFGFERFKNFAQDIGILLTTKEDGKTYPISFEAKNVVSILNNYAVSLGVNITLETKISQIKPLFGEYDFVVVATGSMAASHLGGSDFGYKFAKEFNHTIKTPYPSLVQLHSTNNITKKLSGTKIKANTTLFVNNKKIQQVSGDVLFTNYGLSGLSILDISQKASKALTKQSNNIKVVLDLLPNFRAKELIEHIQITIKNNPNILFIYILYGLIANKIANGVMEFLQINKQITANKISDANISKIIHTLKSWEFEINATHGYRHSEVSGGGVSVDEIDNTTMQSKNKTNLYFCGEVLDVVGDRGGYNFAFAWASAFSASKDIIQKSNIR